MVKESKTNDAKQNNVVKETTTAPEYQYDYVTNGYMQIVPMTFEERVKMYMRCTKEELAKMLAERGRIGLDVYPRPSYPVYPYPAYPNINPFEPYVTYGEYTTASSDINLENSSEAEISVSIEA